MNKPLISVVMSVRNEESGLEYTVDSVLVQTLSDFEFLVINDASVDRTQEILERFARKDPRVRVIVNRQNLGMAASLNIGVVSSRGRYVAMIDGGDLCHPERFEKQVAVLQAHPDIGVLGTSALWIDSNGTVIGKWGVSVEVDGAALYRADEIIHASIMVDRAVFARVGLYDARYRLCHDYEFYARALKNGEVIRNMPEFLVSTMRRQDGVTYRYIRPSQMSRFKIKLVYLPYFLSATNVLSTLRSLVGCVLPSSLLRRLGYRWIMRRGARSQDFPA